MRTSIDRIFRCVSWGAATVMVMTVALTAVLWAGQGPGGGPSPTPGATSAGVRSGADPGRIASVAPRRTGEAPLASSDDRPDSVVAVTTDAAPARSAPARSAPARGRLSALDIPVPNETCLGCHDVTEGSATHRVDFGAAGVDTSACAACHWIGTHPVGHADVQDRACNVCHSTWPARTDWFYAQVSTPSGWFTSASSLEATAGYIHDIHANGSWPAQVTDRAMKCASCHTAAKCSACHTDGPEHGEHALPGFPPSSYRVATGTAEGVTGADTSAEAEVTCTNANCHPLSAAERTRTTRKWEDTSTAFAYSGVWSKAVRKAGTSGGTFAYTATAGSMVTVTFTGPGRMRFISARQYNAGIAQVSLDGGTTSTVDLYGSDSSVYAVVYSADVGPGTHKLKFRATGTKNAASTGRYVYADALIVERTFDATGLVPECESCHEFGSHGSSGSHRVHTNASDPRGPGGLDCSDCHNVAAFPSFTDGEALAGTAVCDGCHSPGGSYDGVDDPVVGAKSIWDTGAYESTATLQAGKAKWCAGCHDGDPSAAGGEPSLIGGVYAPPIAGDESGAYPYGTGWGYYKTGHGLPTAQTYPSSGGYFTGAGLGCEACHDYSTAHIDGLARTFDDSDLSTTPASEYREGYRLKTVDGEEPLLVPLPTMVYANRNTPGNYRLCTQAGCHDPGPFTDAGDTDTNAWSGTVNIHERHMGDNFVRYRADWSGAGSSRMTCVMCHNVHGSKRLAMINDGRLVGREPGLWMWYLGPSVTYNHNNLDYNDPDLPVPDDLPLSYSTGRLWIPQTATANLCTGDCHGNDPKLHEEIRPVYWPGGTPVLGWTYEPGYEGRGVDPQRLLVWGGTVQFRAEYRDKEGQAPVDLRLSVDVDDSGSYEASETYTLSEADAGDTDYTDGKVYYRDLALDFHGDGALDYRFSASDGTFAAVGPASEDNQVIVDLNGKRDVPAEYLTIQAAIDDSHDGDAILVAAGVYAENIDFRGKDVIVESASGPDATYIVGATSPSTVDTPVVTFAGGEGAAATLDGFTIDNSYAGGWKSRGVYVSNSTPSVTGCVIKGNSVNINTNGGGVFITGAAGGAQISDTTIGLPGDYNTARGGGGVYFENSASGALTMTRCLVQNNTTLNQGGGGVAVSGCTNPTVLSETTVTANWIPNISVSGGGILASNSPLVLEDCLVFGQAVGSTVDGAGVALIGASANATVTGSTITSNTGDMAPGIWVNSTANGRLVVSGSTVSSNTGGVSQSGGGITNPWTTVITNSTIASNSVGLEGAGVYAVGATASVSIEGSVIRGNTGRSGVGVYFVNSTVGSLGMTDTVVSGNTGSQEGGGIMLSGASVRARIHDSSIVGNRARHGSGIRVAAGAKLTVSGSSAASSSIRDNITNTNIGLGGGVSLDGSGTALVMSDTTVSGNRCGTAGGGVDVRNSAAATMTGCVVEGNSWNGSTVNADGGGVFSAGTLCLDKCVVRGNSVRRYGGGVYAAGASTIVNSTVSGNKASDTLGSLACYGGGVYWNGNGSIVNSTIAGNHANLNTNNGGGIHFAGGTTYAFRNLIVHGNYCSQGTGKQVGGTPVITYSDIAGGYTGTGNIDADPLFVSPVAYSSAPTQTGDYHLQEASPCEGAGTATGAPADDIDGAARPQGTGYEMGSDEIDVIEGLATGGTEEAPAMTGPQASSGSAPLAAIMNAMFERFAGLFGK